MGDVGDYWRDHKDHRQAVRKHWHACPHCAVKFGTGTLVAPGWACRHHPAWIAPGNKGDDRRAAEAEQLEADRRQTEANSHKKHVCQDCSKRFATEQGLTEHRAKVHKVKKKVSCPHCGRACGGEAGLKQHIRDKHQEAEVLS